MDGQEVLDDVAAEVCRVIRIDRHSQPVCEQLAQVVLLHRREHAQLHIRKGTNCQWNATRDELRDQRRIFDASDAMVDARDAEEVERLANVGGRALLPRMRHCPKPFGARTREDGSKLRGRISQF